MSVDLGTTYLGLKLRNPLVVSACPLSMQLYALQRLEAAGAAAAVLASLFEEKIESEWPSRLRTQKSRRAPCSQRWPLFRILGFPISVDASWLIALFLLTLSFAEGFPASAKHYLPDAPLLSLSTYWAMGLITAVAFFGCIVCCTRLGTLWWRGRAGYVLAESRYFCFRRHRVARRTRLARHRVFSGDRRPVGHRGLGDWAMDRRGGRPLGRRRW